MAKLDALLMPSAVAPSPDTPFQALVDPSIRLRQTVNAINFWVRRAERFNFRVMVVDNTSYAKQIKAALPKSISKSDLLEVHDVPQQSTQDIKRGKGAGETSTLIQGLAHLNLVGDEIVAKVNARYIATNGLFLVDELADEFDFAAWPRPYLDSVDTTFFVGKADFLKKAFEYVYAETDDLLEKFVENLYADYSIRNPQCNFQRFNYSPAIRGQSGTTGSNASPLNEFRVVSAVVRSRKATRGFLSFVKPSYQRGIQK
jgi:hypothetical protein